MRGGGREIERGRKREIEGDRGRVGESGGERGRVGEPLKSTDAMKP